jgi:hypothetical protein
MALDRAFALEPHGGTLQLRGHVLRQAGRYLAAEVAFEGAAQAAEFPAQRQAAEREVRRTRRYAAFPGFRPDTLTPSRHWFAETGAVPLSGSGGAAASDTELLQTFAELASEQQWAFTTLIAVDGWERWSDLATRLEIPITNRMPADETAIPLVAARAPGILPGWADLVEAPATLGRGLSLALELPAEAAPADVLGRLSGVVGSADPALALEAAQHPEGRLRNRILR